MDLTLLPVHKIHKLLREKKITVYETVSAVIEKIEKKDKEINGYTSFYPDEALERAGLLDKKIDSSIPPLYGIPIAVKDNIAIKDKPLTCGSRMLQNFISPYSATVIQRLEAQGAIILGKTNLDEFAMGSSNETSVFGPVHNPFDTKLVAGGSSGGAAAVVAYGGACASLGSDTGGSIRLPASFCGVVGLRPTYGLVSRYGLVAYASSLDQIGPITRDTLDAEIMLQAIGGFDPNDSTSVEKSPMNKSPIRVKDYRIGLPEEYFGDDLDTEIKEAIDYVIKVLTPEIKEFVRISLPHTRYALASYYLIAPAEASSNLARYDGVRYGLRIENGETYIKTRSIGFGSEVKRRIIIGTFVLSRGYYERYYNVAQKVRNIIRDEFLNAFKYVDVILTPVAPLKPFPIGTYIDEPLKMYHCDTFTVPPSLAGLPALALPVKSGIGFQLIGPWFREDLILNLGKVYESSTRRL